MRTIPLKEDLVVEFKSDIKGYSDVGLIDEIVGMTNTKGGELYLGVEDVAELLKITPEQAYSVIKKMVTENKLCKEQGGKYAKYKLVE